MKRLLVAVNTLMAIEWRSILPQNVHEGRTTTQLHPISAVEPSDSARERHPLSSPSFVDLPVTAANFASINRAYPVNADTHYM